MTIPKSPPYQSHGFHCPHPSELIFCLKSFCQNRSRMSCYHGNVSAKTCAAKTCQHNRRTTFASSLEPPHFAPNTALLTIPKSLLTNPRVSLSATQRTHFFALKSFAKTDPGCPATTQCSAKICAAKKCQHNHRTTFASSSSPRPLRPTPLYGPCKMAPLPIPRVFIVRNPANSFFCPQIFCQNRSRMSCHHAMFQRKYVPQKHVSIITARHSPDPSSPALCAQHRSMTMQNDLMASAGVH